MSEPAGLLTSRQRACEVLGRDHHPAPAGDSMWAILPSSRSISSGLVSDSSQPAWRHFSQSATMACAVSVDLPPESGGVESERHAAARRDLLHAGPHLGRGPVAENRVQPL